MGRIRCLLTAIALLASGAHAQSAPVRLLFLGDHGHHEPQARAEAATAAWAAEGIALRYADDTAQLDGALLAEYDCVLVYNNTDLLAPPREAALIRFVEAGGGLVVVHCGSYAYGNSDAYTRLVGGRFLRHGAEDFRARIVDAQHPAMCGVTSYTGWDETYEHDRLAKDIRVLMTRDTAAGSEPYCWVREQGAGRIYYNALGHDLRAWGHPAFQRMIAQGILWAAGRANDELPPVPRIPAMLPALEPDAPAPLSPEDSMRRMHLPEGFQVALFAAEPDIVKPIAMCWDARGRLWIAESLDYPNNPLPEGQGNDRIKLCEDTDGDHRADRFVVAAEKLNIPTGITPYKDGLIVACMPDILFLRDTDGDDVMDTKEILYTGFERWDTHAVVSNLRYGFDNWIWATVGYSGGRLDINGRRIEFQQGIIRFRPDGSDFEYLTRTSNNTWGLGFTEEGDVFASTANNEHSVYFAIPNRVYESVHGWSGTGNAGCADHKDMHPIARYRQFDYIGGYTAAAGHAPYTARDFPPLYWNRAAFICEPTGHLIHVDWILPEGSGFVARDGYNLLASSDEWTAPIMAEVGPDGALWFIDWYNYIIRHNPTPEGFETGKGNAYVTGMRDNRHGRIYRITHRDGKHDAVPQNGDLDLRAALNSDNLFWRLTAQRVLVERAANAPMADAAAPLSLHTARIREAVGAPLTPAELETLLAAPDPASRRLALALATDTKRLPLAAILAATADSDARVAREALLCLASMPADAAAGRALFQIMHETRISQDPWLRDAAIAAAARHAEGFLRDAWPRLAAPVAQTADGANLLPSTALEAGTALRPAGWEPAVYSGTADFDWVPEGRNGGRCLRIRSENGADAGWLAWVEVTPQTDYRLSGWIRTKDLERIGDARGALLNVHNLQPLQTPALTGSTDWTEVAVDFNSGNEMRLGINALFGGWGQAAGVAWFDDLQLRPAPRSDLLRNAAAIVLRHVAGSGDARLSREILVKAAHANNPALLGMVLNTLQSGWPADAAPPTLAENDAVLLQRVFQEAEAGARTSLLLLLRKWRSETILGTAASTAYDQALEAYEEPETAATARTQAAKFLLAWEDSPQMLARLAAAITPQAPPGFVEALIDVLQQSRRPEAADEILSRWRTLTPRVRTKALGMLLRRDEWTRSLLDAMDQGRVAPGDLSGPDTQRLLHHPKNEINERAKTILQRDQDPREREARLAPFLAAADRRGDPARGEQVFAENCRVCHAIAGQGGETGPALDTFAKNDRKTILLEILDPNRSVEGNYRQWHVTTLDGENYSGRLYRDSASAIELLDAQGQRQRIFRKQIESMTISPLSVMPEGFERLGLEALGDLLAYLQAVAQGTPARPTK